MKLALALAEPSTLKDVEEWCATARAAGCGDLDEVSVSYQELAVTFQRDES